MSSIISKEFKICGNELRLFSPFYIIGQKNIVFGNNFTSLKGLRIEAYDQHLGNKYTPEIIIGNNVSMNFDCHIACISKIQIGDNVLIASKVFITDHFHGNIDKEQLAIAPSERKATSKGPVIIGNNVWIGEGVAIMPNVNIGNNCIIGANSVVTKSFPANSILAGNPARIIKTL